MTVSVVAGIVGSKIESAGQFLEYDENDGKQHLRALWAIEAIVASLPAMKEVATDSLAKAYNLIANGRMRSKRRSLFR